MVRLLLRLVAVSSAGYPGFVVAELVASVVLARGGFVAFVQVASVGCGRPPCVVHSSKGQILCRCRVAVLTNVSPA